VDRVLVNGYPARIIPWENSLDSADVMGGHNMKINLPATYFSGTTSSCKLELNYYGNLNKVITQDLVVNPVIQPGGYLYWQDIVLYAQGESESNFFNSKTGEIYSTCEVETYKDDVYLYLYAGTNYLQISNPQVQINKVNQYFCGDVALADNLLQNFIMYRTLLSTDTGDKKTLHDYILNGQITEGFSLLSQVASLKASGNQLKYLAPGVAGTSGFLDGEPAIFQRMDNVTDKNVLNNGFFVVKKIMYDGKKSYVILDIYFQN
jgi:hypothetical protein